MWEGAMTLVRRGYAGIEVRKTSRGEFRAYLSSNCGQVASSGKRRDYQFSEEICHLVLIHEDFRSMSTIFVMNLVKKQKDRVWRPWGAHG